MWQNTHTPCAFIFDSLAMYLRCLSNFQLPDPAGRAGGACTSTLLNILYKDEQATNKDLSFVEVLDAMRVQLRRQNFEQIPQLTSTRELDLTHKFDLVPDGFSGTKYAVMIGINYVGHSSGELVRMVLHRFVSFRGLRQDTMWGWGFHGGLCHSCCVPFLSPPLSADATMMLETWYVHRSRIHSNSNNHNHLV